VDLLRWVRGVYHIVDSGGEGNSQREDSIADAERFGGVLGGVLGVFGGVLGVMEVVEVVEGILGRGVNSRDEVS
jgi:hypothetical protein